VPGACDLAEWNVPHAPHEHRSLLVEIDGGWKKGLAKRVATPNFFWPALRRFREEPLTPSSAITCRANFEVPDRANFAAPDPVRLSGRRLPLVPDHPRHDKR
jgi:hypothetical protein